MPDIMSDSLLGGTLLVMGLSLIFMIVIPILPGQFIIWLAALVYGILAGWEVLGWGTFAFLTMLMIVAAVIDFVAGWIGARKGGASWPGVATGLAVGCVGLIFFNAFGAIIGILAGILFYEYRQNEDFKQSWKAASGYLIGMLFSLIVRFGIAIVMVVVFFRQVR